MPADEDAASMADVSPNQAPAFQQMVADGTLPPLEDRLPAEPLVVEPVDAIGNYGGIWRAGLRGGSDNAWIYRTIAYDQMVSWERDWSGVRPNVAKSWDISDDSTTYTYHLREGMKWSDGEPFTASDVVWWYDNVIRNEEISISVPTWLRSGDVPATVTMSDDYTVIFTYPEANGVLNLRLASPSGPPATSYPAHFMQQFHVDFNSEVAAIAEAEGFETWVDYFLDHNGGGCCGFYRDSDLPVLWAWNLTSSYGENTTTVRAERNPYYWKVDTEGNQLPYIDTVIYNVGSNPETLVLQALAGEIDYQGRHIATLGNKSAFFDVQESAGITLTDRLSADNNVMEISLNLNHPDPVKNEIFNNIHFRIGLSHAINRQELIDVVLVGQGEPWQAAPLESSPYYNERLATQYTEYSPEIANQHLDAAGYTERDSNGIRLGPDGEPIAFTVDVITVATDQIDMMNLISQYWAEVGVKMTPNVLDRSLGQQRLEAIEHDGNTWGAPGGIGYGTLLDPRNFLPIHGHSRYGYGWYLWYINPDNEAAVEPPDIVKKQLDLYALVNKTADPVAQTALMNEILEISADQFYAIGISKPAPAYAVANQNLRNIMEWMPAAWQYPTPGPGDTFQFYYDE
jgi:peptide/nickel transport system substrate-binding protein